MTDTGKSVDDFEAGIPFARRELTEDEQENYEGAWLLNLPSGRTLEFRSEADALAFIAEGRGRE